MTVQPRSHNIKKHRMHPSHSNNTHKQQTQRWNAVYLAIGVMALYFLIAFVRTTRPMDNIDHATSHYLRSNEHSEADFFSPPALESLKQYDIYDGSLARSLWNDEFFSPLLESPLLQELHMKQHEMWMDPVFHMSEGDGKVMLKLAIPDVALDDIDIEVLGGRVIHISGEKTTDNSHVSFDKRFSIGQHVDASKLEATLTKGELVLSAAKSEGNKDDVRKIQITKEEL